MSFYLSSQLPNVLLYALIDLFKIKHGLIRLGCYSSHSALLWHIFSGDVDDFKLAASGTWPPQLPPGWTVEWDPSLDDEDQDH